MIRPPRNPHIPRTVRVVVWWALRKLDKMIDGAAVAFGVFLVTFAGFVVIAPDTAKELIFNQKLEIRTPEVQVDVSLGAELTDILRRIEAKLQ